MPRLPTLWCIRRSSNCRCTSGRRSIRSIDDRSTVVPALSSSCVVGKCSDAVMTSIPTAGARRSRVLWGRKANGRDPIVETQHKGGQPERAAGKGIKCVQRLLAHEAVGVEKLQPAILVGRHSDRHGRRSETVEDRSFQRGHGGAGSVTEDRAQHDRHLLDRFGRVTVEIVKELAQPLAVVASGLDFKNDVVHQADRRPVDVCGAALPPFSFARHIQLIPRPDRPFDMEMPESCDPGSYQWHRPPVVSNRAVRASRLQPKQWPGRGCPQCSAS